MAERLEIQRPEGTADANLFVPPGDGPFPLVVFYMDAGGLRPAMTTMAERLAANGFAVLQPNLYWRSGAFRPFEMATVFTDPAERARIGGMIAQVKPDDVVAETLAFLDVLKADRRVRTDRIATQGYCMGGKMAFIVGTRLGERVAAVAAIHAGGLVTDAPDSPHRGVAGLRGRVYLGVAADDNSCTPAHQQALREALDAAGVRYELENYAARHGWTVPDFPIYDHAAAEHHWAKVLALLAELR
jgi:carboxymethylenebutenolidase